MNRRIIVFAAATLFLAGCGMPRKVHEEGKQMAADIAEAKKSVAEREANYSKMFQGEKQWLTPYASKEKWQDKITEAKNETIRLESIYKAKLAPLLDKNKRDSESNAMGLLGQLGDGLGKVKELARYPSIRAAELENFKANATEINKKALADNAAILAVAQPLLQYIATVRTGHPDCLDSIQKRTGIAQSLSVQASQASSTIRAQFASHAAGRDADYAAFGDSGKLLSEIQEKIKTENDRIRRECPALDQSWTRTLIDMKQRYFAQISQVSWRESESIEYPAETMYARPWIEVSGAVYDKLDDLPDNTVIAKLRSGFFGGGFTPEISGDLLSVLQLSDGDAMMGFPDGDNEADYEIDELRADSYHRYADEKNGVITESDWIPVSSEFYEDHFNDLGMTLEAKPYGKFADEIVEEAAPAGMAYVGDTKYGRWRNDASGNSFWEFYGKYALFRSLIGMGHPGYSRTEWGEYRSYRDRDQPYYGGTSTAPRYGSGSSTIQTDSRYAGSDFAKGGGFHTAQADIRSAGVNTRGGGPGGGGK